jgi:hypothetical protein
MSELFEIDPVTGIRSDLSWSESDQKMTLIRTADVEPVLDFTKACANEAGLNREGIKAGWWLYAKLPPIVIVQMLAKGINPFDANDQKKMFEEINANFKHLKCTTGAEGASSSKQVFLG